MSRPNLYQMPKRSGGDESQDARPIGEKPRWAESLEVMSPEAELILERFYMVECGLAAGFDEQGNYIVDRSRVQQFLGDTLGPLWYDNSNKRG